MSDIRSQGISPTWDQLLERMELALKRVEDEAAIREKSISCSEESPGVAEDRGAALKAEQSHGADWQSRMQRVEEQVREADRELESELDGFVRWQADLQRLGQKLAHAGAQ